MKNSRPGIGKVLEFWSFDKSPGKVLEFKNKGLKKKCTCFLLARCQKRQINLWAIRTYVMCLNCVCWFVFLNASSHLCFQLFVTWLQKRFNRYNYNTSRSFKNHIWSWKSPGMLSQKVCGNPVTGWADLWIGWGTAHGTNVRQWLQPWDACA